MISLVTLGLPALLVAAAVYWMRPRRGLPRPASWRSTVLLLLTWAAGILWYHPHLQAAADEVTRDLAKLVSNTLMLCASLLVVSWLLSLNYERPEALRRLRPRLVFLALVLAVMALSFLITPPDRRWSGPSTSAHWDQAPMTLHLYTLVYAAFMGTAVYDCLSQTWRRSPMTTWRIHRAGLRTTAAGCFFVLLYLTYRIVHTASSVAGFELVSGGPRCTTLVSPLGCTFSFTAPLAGIVLITAGLTVPAMLWPAAKKLRQRWEIRTTRELFPLWDDLTALCPQVVLRTVAATTETDLLLHRRVVEVCDGILVLSANRSREVERFATRAVASRGLAGTETGAAIVEAAVIAAAVEAARTGARDEDDPAPLATGDAAREGNLRAEAQWLRSVSRQYTTSDIVRTAVAAQQTERMIRQLSAVPVRP
ncbi:MAB_1171c family putative transporter [Kitasatospora sp. NPDC001664]